MILVFQVFIQGHKNLNRAVNDDIVAIEMLPEEEWSCPSSLVLEETEEKTDDADIEVEVGTCMLACPVFEEKMSIGKCCDTLGVIIIFLVVIDSMLKVLMLFMYLFLYSGIEFTLVTIVIFTFTSFLPYKSVTLTFLATFS